MDLVLRNATLVDGSGAAARPAEVGVDGGRIAALGDVSTRGDVELDLEGLVLAPGFIDVHTHYDAQPFWDPSLSPSSWHGVTTVVTGNCGFGIAPTRARHRGLIAGLMENAEGMSVAALEAGIVWDFESFPEYLDALDERSPRLNVATLVGHSPLRVYVMGDAAHERAASDAEIEQMVTLLGQALDAGALGFATSRSPYSIGDRGRPVPSRQADEREVDRLVAVLGAAGRGIVEVTPGPGLGFAEMAALSKRHGIPFTWAGALTGFAEHGADFAGVPELANPPWKMLEIQAGLGGEVWPQVLCRPLTSQFTLTNPAGSFRALPAFEPLMALPPERRAGLYRDPAWLEAARVEVSQAWNARWSSVCVAETQAHPELVDVPLDEAAAARGVHPFDLIVQTGLDDELRTRFRVTSMNDDEPELARVINDRRSVLGLSDAGAHQSQTCDACFATHLLGYWVREKQVLGLEDAVWRLAGQPAEVFRIPGRGLVREGYAADLVAFDPDTVGTGRTERLWDLPAGEDRMVIHSTGIEHAWVNGEAIWADGAEVADSGPGGVLRFGRELPRP